MSTEVATRQFDVKVFYAHCKGEGFVSADDSYITFARAYTVNGMYVSEDWAELIFQPWGCLLLKPPWCLLLKPPPDEGRETFAVPYREFLGSLTADEYLEEPCFDGGITIPVSRIEFIEGNWFDYRED